MTHPRVRASLGKRSIHDDRRAALACAAGALLLSLPAVARADGASEAKDLFAQGRALRSADRCAEAIPLFRHALELYPAGLGSERNIAECEEHLGHFAAARRTWLDLERALASTTEPKYADWTRDADQATARLAARVATLTIDLAGRGTEAVTVNGAPWTASGTPVDVDPGHYVVRSEGAVPVEQTVDLSAGEARRVTFRAIDAGPAAPAGALAPLPAVAHDGRQPLRIGGWVALGVGVASFAGAGISAAVRARALEEYHGACPDGHCPMSLSGTVERGVTASTLVNVFVGVGSASVAGSVVLFVLGHGVSPASEVQVTPSGVAVAGRF